MKNPLISQIVAENDYVQRLHAGHGVNTLITAYKRIKKLTGQLKRYDPETKSYCLAFTILSIGAETEVVQLNQHRNTASDNDRARTNYILSFERLQYQTNLAVSILS